MFKLLLVDDEDFVLEGMRNSIDWESFGIEIVGEARDGMEALNILTNNIVDILITDIKMPIMDGLELIEQVRNQGYNCKIVVLTGFDEFEYAKKSITFKVFEYILKPATIRKIKDVLKKLVIELQAENEKHNRSREMEEKIEKSLPLLIERFYYNLLNGDYQKEMPILLGIDVNANRYKVVIVHIDNIYSIKDNNITLTNKEKQLLALSVYEIIKDNLIEGYDVVILQQSISDIVILYKLKLSESSEELQYNLGIIKGKMLELKSISVSIGIGKSYKNISQVGQSFLQAQEALKHKLYYGNGSIITYKDIAINQGSYLDNMIEWKKNLTDAINLRDESIAINTLNAIKVTMQKESRYTIEYVRNISMEIILIASLLLYDKNEKIENICTSYTNILCTIQNIETISDAFSLLTEVYLTVIKYLNSKGHTKNKGIIDTVIKYINENIAEDITLEKASQEVFFTPNYLGYVFKQNVGIGFNEYVTKCRMELAMKLLKNKGCKIYQVSIQVGYKSPYYFSKLFKEYTGYAPSEYKE